VLNGIDEGEDRDLPDRPDTAEMEEILNMERIFTEGKTEELPPRVVEDEDSDDDTTDSKAEAVRSPAKSPASSSSSVVKLPPIALGSLTAAGAAAASTNGDASPRGAKPRPVDSNHVDTPREPGPTEHPLAGLGNATLKVTERKDSIPSSPTSAAVVAAANAASGGGTPATPRPAPGPLADLLDSNDIIGS
jgi:hypothetical protein